MANTLSLEKIADLFSTIAPKTDNRTKVSPFLFVVYLVLDLSKDNSKRSIAGMCRSLQQETGITISRSSFWERLSRKRLNTLLNALIDGLMLQVFGNILVTKAMLQQLGVIKVYLFDSTTITLTDSAINHFKGVNGKAGIKLHACINLFSGSIEWFKLTESKCHDRICFPEVNLFTGTLVIFDLGYFDYQLMTALIDVGAFFLCRLKDNSVVYITEVMSGLPSKAIGQSLLKACKQNKHDADMIEVKIQKLINGKILDCRAIGFWNSTDKHYHWYLTNLVVPAKLIYVLYRLRWQIELAFKSCKSILNLDEIGSANPMIVENFILATIAANLASQSIRDVVSTELSEKQKGTSKNSKIPSQNSECSIFLKIPPQRAQTRRPPPVSGVIRLGLCHSRRTCPVAFQQLSQAHHVVHQVH